MYGRVVPCYKLYLPIISPNIKKCYFLKAGHWVERPPGLPTVREVGIIGMPGRDEDPPLSIGADL